MKNNDHRLEVEATMPFKLRHILMFFFSSYLERDDNGVGEG
jgi:hypothetical protein